jgi:RNA polymerase sigma factor
MDLQRCSGNSQVNLRKNEIIAYQSILGEYDISFQELVQLCPAEKSKQIAAQEMAKRIADDPKAEWYLNHLKCPKRQQRFQNETEISPKYIIALALMFYHHFQHLTDYIE